MDAILIGYFPKKTKLIPEWLKAGNVEMVCSASTCISEEPEGWINHWKHNECFLYNTIGDARSILDKLNDKNGYDIYAFKKYPIRLENGSSAEEIIPSVSVEPLNENFEFLGYDAVSMSMSPIFECSPLSCNRGAETMKVNKYCLFETFEKALSGAVEFSKGNWEPGPYYIVEVYRLIK
jgi:hypothetical protein